MDAYYYGFYETGVKEIDLILSAIACAGKAFHSTENWTDYLYGKPSKSPYNDKLIGETPVDWIQNAAKNAAEKINELKKQLGTNVPKDENVPSEKDGSEGINFIAKNVDRDGAI